MIIRGICDSNDDEVTRKNTTKNLSIYEKSAPMMLEKTWRII